MALGGKQGIGILLGPNLLTPPDLAIHPERLP